MKAKPEYRKRGETEVAILDALVDRGEEGMSVLELRASVDANIDTIESGLASLKRDGLITVSESDGSTVIRPVDRVMPDPNDRPREKSFFDQLRERLPF